MVATCLLLARYAHSSPNNLTPLGTEKTFTSNYLTYGYIQDDTVYKLRNGEADIAFSDLQRQETERSNALKQRVNEQSRVTLEKSYCSCVLHAKALTGFSISIGLAKRWPRNSEIPSIGAVVITKESPSGTNTGHVAQIIDIQDGYLILDEANYQRCQRTVGRKLPINSPLILGYWNGNQN